MEVIDARKLTQEAQEVLRLRAVRCVIEDQRTCTEAAKLFGVARGVASKWVSTYRRQGESGLYKKKRGRRSADMRALKPYQCAAIVNMIRDHCPDQLKLPFALWTREAVRDLIARRYEIVLALNTVGLYLKRWGFTPQKPLRRAYERQDAQVRKWLEETYPAIAKRALQERAEIHWGDEAGFRSDRQTGTRYSPKGQTPVINVTGRRFRAAMISTITNKGSLRFMVFDESFTVDALLTFLERLTHKAQRKIFLILDNHKVHHAYRIQRWVEANKGKIELFYLPPYSPELNPDELLNQDVKSNAVGRKRAKSLPELKTSLRQYLMSAKRSPHIVRSYFLKDTVL